LQRLRAKRNSSQSLSTEAFPENFKVPKVGFHWYAYNVGGRTEAQFNIAMNPGKDGWLRVGIAFHFGSEKHGDPEKVKKHFATFVDEVRYYEADFKNFTKKEHLQIDWDGVDLRDSENCQGSRINSKQVYDWLTLTADNWDLEFVFIGRFLKRGLDRKILEDSEALDELIRSVFTGFKDPFWVATQ
jgi:hypothetical protein